MSSRPRRLAAALLAAVAVSPALTLVPAHAASQTAVLSMSPTVNENVTFAAAGFTTPVKVGRKVDLQVKTGSRWSTVKTVTQDQYGGLSFYAKVGRTSKASSSKGYETRSFRLRARASGSLKEKTSSTTKVKVLLDPKVYYRVVKATVQHTGNVAMNANGCGIGVGWAVTHKTDSALGKAESGRPRWRAQRQSDGSIRTELSPALATTWKQDLSGCAYEPRPAHACTTTRTESPTGDGKEALGVRVSVPRSGSGSVMFSTRRLTAGYADASDAVCNVPYITSDEVPVGIRTKKVSRSTLLGKKAFTVTLQGDTAWTTDRVSGRPADLKLRFTESITLQRVDSKGRALR